MPNNNIKQIAKCIQSLRESAAQYYQLTGKPIGVTGEIGEYDAARLLGMELTTARQAGYDAVKPNGEKVQIKTRALKDTSKILGQRIGAIKTTHDWESVMLVIMDLKYQPYAIYEAERSVIEHAIDRLTSKARNSGKLSIAEFIRFSKKVWEL